MNITVEQLAALHQIANYEPTVDAHDAFYRVREIARKAVREVVHRKCKLSSNGRQCALPVLHDGPCEY